MEYPKLPANQHARFLKVYNDYRLRNSNFRKEAPLYQIVNDAIRTESKLHSPLAVLIDLTNKCNQDCVFCYRGGQVGLKNEADSITFRTLPEMENIFLQLKQMNVPAVSLSGGEVGCHPDLVPIVKMAKSFGFILTIVTNGTLFKENDIRQIARVFDFNTDKFELSLDAADPATYQAVRKSKLFSNVLDTLSHFREFKIPFITMTLLLKENLHSTIDILKLSKQYNALVSAVEPPFPKSFMSFEKFALPDQVLATYEKILSEEGLSDQHITFNFLHFSIMAGVYEELINVIGRHKLSGCHAGFSTCTIDIRGDLHLCSYLIQSGSTLVGNINEFHIRELWEKAQRMRCSLEYRCSGCPAFDYDKPGANAGSFIE